MDAIGFGARIVAHRPGQRVAAAAAAAFDFTGAALPPGATLKRASSANRYDAGGALVAATADVARIEPGGRGLLLEPAGSNALPYSADWTAPAWTQRYVAASPVALIEDMSAGVGHFVRQAGGALSYTAGQAATMSAVAAERGGPAKRYLVLTIGAPPVFAGVTNAIFDLAAGTVGATNNAVAGTVALGGGTWLCWLSASAATTGTTSAAIVKLTDDATLDRAYAGDGASGLAVSNVQIEPGASAGSRIVTGAAAGSRAADLLTLAWGTRGVADGTIAVRYTFDDGSTQDVATTVSGGTASVPLTLARRWLRRAEKI